MISNKSNRQLISISLLLIIVMVFAKRVSSLEVNPYIGIDKQMNHMRFKEKHTNSLFPKHYQQLNLYTGLKFNNSWSAEIGYIATSSKNKCATFYTGDVVSEAIPLPDILSPVTFKSYIKVRGYHLGVVNTYCRDEWDGLRLLWGAGFSFLKAEAQRDTLSLSNLPFKGNVRTFKKQKAVIRLLGAAEYKFKNSLGVRGSVCFIQTSKMIIKAHPVSGSFTPIIRPKDSIIFSLGAFFDF